MRQIITKKHSKESFNPIWDKKTYQEVPFNKEKSFRLKRLWRTSYRNKTLNLDKILQTDKTLNPDKILQTDKALPTNRIVKPNRKALSSKKPICQLSNRIKKNRAFLNSKGQGLIEYLILVALMGVATIAIIRTLNQTVKSRFANSIYALQGRNQKAKTHNLRKEEYQRSDLSNFMTGSASKDKKRNSKR